MMNEFVLENLEDATEDMEDNMLRSIDALRDWEDMDENERSYKIAFILKEYRLWNNKQNYFWNRVMQEIQDELEKTSE